MALLEVRSLARSFYGVHALNGVDLHEAGWSDGGDVPVGQTFAALAASALLELTRI